MYDNVILLVQLMNEIIYWSLKCLVYVIIQLRLVIKYVQLVRHWYLGRNVFVRWGYIPEDTTTDYNKTESTLPITQ